MPDINSQTYIIAAVASVGGSLITFIAKWVFTKSEDSASKTYVDAKCEKLESRIEKKVDRVEFDRVSKALDTQNADIKAIYNLLITMNNKNEK